MPPPENLHRSPVLMATRIFTVSPSASSASSRSKAPPDRQPARERTLTEHAARRPEAASN